MATIKEDIEPIFNMPSFYEMFIVLNVKYTELQFHDEISDNERIAEYKWITQQYRKYISKQRDVILSHNKQEDMLKENDSMIAKASEYGNNRMEIVYNFIRDEFLANAYRIIELYVPEQDEEGWEE